MQSGLFWGTVGAIRQLIEQLPPAAATRPQVFLTGGAGPAVADSWARRPLRAAPDPGRHRLGGRQLLDRELSS